MPAELSSLVGRERDLYELQEILASSRLITLTGPGGVGKTRLALRLGSMTGEAFRDGVWLVELAGVVDHQLVTETAATALGVRAAGAHTVEQALVRALQATRMLLILDNCEHVLAACSVLISNLLSGCPHLHVLATSRESLGIAGEVAWRVGSLTLPPPAPTLDEAHTAPAVQLFAQRAHAAAPGFQLTSDNATSVSEVCRRLDGLPLAIELAAAAVPSLAISQLAARLATQLDLLSAGPSAPARQQTLGATLNWSYNLLTQPEQLLLRRTAVFAGGWWLEAVEAVCSDASLSRDQVVQSLTRLVARSLVSAEVDPDGELRYRLLEIVRTFAFEHLQRSGEVADVQARHFAFFADNAQRVEPHLHTADPGEFADQLERDLDNLRAALDWSLSGAAPDDGLRMATSLRYFWFMRGHYREGGDRLRSALTVAIAAEPRLRAPALCSLGFMLVVQGQHAEARVHLESGLEVGRLLADDQIIAFAYRYLGLIANAEARYGDAHDYLEHSLERYRVHGSPDDVALTLMYLGDACLYQNGVARAQRLFEESIAILTQLQNKTVLPYPLRRLAQIARLRGDSRLAVENCLRSLAYNREVGEQQGIAASLVGLALVAQERGHVRTAAQLLGKTEALLAEIGSRLLPTDDVELKLALDRVRTRLAPAEWTGARATGVQQSLDDLVRIAEELADSAPPPALGLTPRQSEILRLVATGHTNREIAETLALSVATVERHLANIYARIGARGRADATLFAARAGLLSGEPPVG